MRSLRPIHVVLWIEIATLMLYIAFNVSPSPLVGIMKHHSLIWGEREL